MAAPLVLAVAIGVGTLPIPPNVMRFPDPTAFLGAGSRQEANMVAETLAEAGGAMLAVGPGPQQLVARWLAGDLNAAEKASVLLGGAAFHDPALLRVYDEAAGSSDLRLRKAAAVGFFSLVGEAGTLPSSLRDDPAEWDRLRRMIRALGWATRTRTLVGVWVDSTYAAKGYPPAGAFVFKRTPAECLRAIREIAAPEDLPEILAMWPVLDELDERGHAMRTIEIITMQKLVARSPDAHQPSGLWQIDAAIDAVDQWVARLCKPIDGQAQLRLAFRANELLDLDGSIRPAGWFGFLRFRSPSFSPLALERLAELSGMPIRVDRQRLDNPANHDVYRKLSERFPISSQPPAVSRGRR